MLPATPEAGCAMARIRTSTLGCAAIGLALAGCGEETDPSWGEASSNVGAEVEAPAPAQQQQPSSSEPDDRMRWHFSRTDRGPKLVYGEPRTDNVRLMLRCPPGGDSAILSFHRPSTLVRRRPEELRLASGAAEQTYAVDARESALGGMTVEIVVPVDSGPLREFGDGQPLSLHWGDETIAVPTAAEAGRFLRVCGPF